MDHKRLVWLSWLWCLSSCPAGTDGKERCAEALVLARSGSVAHALKEVPFRSVLERFQRAGCRC